MSNFFLISPRETNNLHEKIEIFQSVEDKDYKESIGVIEVIATSVFQQLSVVFEEGGGPSTEINFGMLYYGQSKECSAFLVNNGPKSIEYNFFFHPDKRKEDISPDDSEYVCTPEAAGIEMTQRILSASPINGVIKPYSQIPIKFICNTKMPKDENKSKVYISEEYEKIQHKSEKEKSAPALFISTAAIKFDEYIPLYKREKELIKSTDDDNKICTPVTVYMEVKCIDPIITIDKPSLNFWESKLHEQKIIPLVITNRNEELPIDFNFNKIPHFTVVPIKGVIMPRETQTIHVSFHPENYGNFNDTLILKYINNIYSLPIKVFGICKEKGDKKNKVMLTEKNYLDVAKGEIIVPDSLAKDYTKPKKQKVDPNLGMNNFYKYQVDKLTKDKDGGTLEVFEEKWKEFGKHKENKDKANQDLETMRMQRLRKNDPKARVMDRLVIDDKSDKLELLELLINDKDNRCESPKLKIPEAKEKVWVVKPIGKYEPATYAEMDEGKESFNIDETPEAYRERKAKRRL